MFLKSLFAVLVHATSASPEGATISSGTIFTAVDGGPVHAHGAGLILPSSHPAGANGDYYMVGTSAKVNWGEGWLSGGINMYRSADLQHWELVNTIFHNTSITTPIPSGQPHAYRIERPKVIYNAATKKYVMYFHLDSQGFKMGMVGVCTCDTVGGQYLFVDGFQPDGQRSLDMGLFQVRETALKSGERHSSLGTEPRTPAALLQATPRACTRRAVGL
jgi:hypothetical protein